MTALTLFPLSTIAQDRKQAPPPNVLFIAIDDLNDWLGCLGGHPDVKTPHLDSLAKRGVLFTNAYCPAPASNPSRAAVMTGIRPSTSGVYNNYQPWRNSLALKKAVTLPQHFMRHGYKTLGSGKIYHCSFPDPASWNTYWPSQTKNRPREPKPAIKAHEGKDFSHWWGPLEVSSEKMGDWRVADWVIDQLGRKHEKPFFLACGFFRPHKPWYVPQEYFDMYPFDKITLPNVKGNDLDDILSADLKWKSSKHRSMLESNVWRNAVQGYLASISFVDECVGRVLNALDNSSYRDNTIIVLWSDNGYHLGEKSRVGKFTLWEEATHTVLIFVAPGVTSAGGRCDAPVSLLDIYPTLIDLCGFSPKKELEGTTLLSLLEKPDAKWELSALTTYGYKNHSIRTRRWRYISYRDGTEELYDHSNDDLEWTNLANNTKYDDVKSKLRQFLPKINAKPIAW